MEESLAGFAYYGIAIDTINEALALDPSSVSEEDNHIRDAITRGKVELRTAISQKATLTESEFSDWFDAVVAESNDNVSKGVQGLLDAIDVGAVDKDAVIEVLKKNIAEDEK